MSLKTKTRKYSPYTPVCLEAVSSF